MIWEARAGCREGRLQNVEEADTEFRCAPEVAGEERRKRPGSRPSGNKWFKEAA